MAHRPNIRNASIQCTSAIKNLATLPDNLQNRIIAACVGGFFHVNPEDLPDELREDYEALRERVTAKDIVNPNEGRVHATLREMDEDEARDVATELFAFVQAVWRESSRSRSQSQ